MVGLRAKISRMRVLSSASVIEHADLVMKLIVDTYLAPNKSPSELRELMISGKLDVLRDFSEACRIELGNVRAPYGSNRSAIVFASAAKNPGATGVAFRLPGLLRRHSPSKDPRLSTPLRLLAITAQLDRNALRPARNKLTDAAEAHSSPRFQRQIRRPTSPSAKIYLLRPSSVNAGARLIVIVAPTPNQL